MFCSGDLISPSAAYMRQWTGWAMAQKMACRLIGAKPLSKPCWVIVNWTLRNKLQWNFNQNTKLFIHGNAYENIVCEMAAILSRGRWVKEPLILPIPFMSRSLHWHWQNPRWRHDISFLHYFKMFSYINDVEKRFADRRNFPKWLRSRKVLCNVGSSAW